MNVISRAAVIGLLPWFLSTAYAADKTKVKKPAKPKFTISKETTRITEPLTSDGYVDYATAINQRLSRGVTPENNANVLFWQAHGPHPEGATMPREFFRWLGIDSPKEEGEYFVGLGDYLRKRANIDPKDPRFVAVIEQQTKSSSQPWKAADYPHIAGWLKANEGPLKLVVQGTKRTRYFSPLIIHEDKDGQPMGLINVLLPAVQASREFARALTARAMLHLGAGRVEAARQDLIACHRLGRHVGQGATLIEALVGMAIDSMTTQADLAFIDHAKPNAKQAAAYLRELDSLPPRPDMVRYVDVTERFTCLDAVQLIARSGFAGLKAITGSDVNPGVLDKFGMSMIDWDVTMRICNHWYDRQVAAMRITDDSKRHTALEEIDKGLAKMMKDNPVKSWADLIAATKSLPKIMGTRIGTQLTAVHFAAFSGAQGFEYRARQESHNLRVALALAAHHSDRGRYPEKLSELGPKYLKTLPGDLFSGRPLAYRVTKDGYLLYSFGLNGKDDQGRWYTDKPPGDDVRVRMPLPR